MELSYQLPKMDFIAIDDFSMGAMECWGLISFKSSRLLVKEGFLNRQRIQDISNIISHELVHQFFGNEVTMAWWSEVWLNEGFATFLEKVIVDRVRKVFLNISIIN